MRPLLAHRMMQQTGGWFDSDLRDAGVKTGRFQLGTIDSVASNVRASSDGLRLHVILCQCAFDPAT